MSAPREDAWRLLHDPATAAATLADIARAYPEFADAIRRHPNCYDALREWADSVRMGTAAQTPSSPADVRASAGAGPRRRSRGPLVVGAALGGVVVVGGLVAAAAVLLTSPGHGQAEAPPPATADASPAGERRLDAPPVYVGDELSLFLLDARELVPFIPDAANGQISDRLLTIGEGEGVRTDPASCVNWIIPDEGTVTGTRAAQWNRLGYTTNSMTVRQFPTRELAGRWAAPFVDGTCESFVFGQMDPLTVQMKAKAVGRIDDRVVAVHLQRDGSPERTVIVGVESNVVVTIDTDLELSETDAASLASLVNDKIIAARAAVTEKIGYR